MPGSKNWREIRDQKPGNEARVRTYERLIEAERVLITTRERRGLPETALADALDAAESDASDEDLFLAALSRYAAALGGYVEVRAVFPDENVVVLVEGEGHR